LALARISRATGLNIVMGAGYYAGPSLPHDTDAKSEDEIVDEVVSEIQMGIGTSGVRAGIIGEVGCMWPLEEIEKKILRASARAQRLTGAPLTIHPGRHESAALEIIEFLDYAGADLQRTIICHVDRNVFDPARRLQRAEECAKAGCWIEYDCFGWESYYPLGHAKQTGFDLPNDRQRVDDISKLIDKGYLGQILVSQDICRKMSLCRYGGNGYAHIIQNVLPRMRDHGITDSAINTILLKNPKRILTFAQPSRN
jgi:phosphotriesterase-related protein